MIVAVLPCAVHAEFVCWRAGRAERGDANTGIHIARVDGRPFTMKDAALRHLVGYPLSTMAFFSASWMCGTRASKGGTIRCPHHCCKSRWTLEVLENNVDFHRSTERLRASIIKLDRPKLTMPLLSQRHMHRRSVRFAPSRRASPGGRSSPARRYGERQRPFLTGSAQPHDAALRGDLIRIGETEIEYSSGEQDMLSGATVYLSGPPASQLPADTITSPIASRSTTDLISSIQSGNISAGMRAAASGVRPAVTEAPNRDLLSIVSQVGIALLPTTTLEDTLKLTIDLVFQAIPADRGSLS